MHNLPARQLVVCLLFALLCSGCTGTKSAWIYLDNGLEVEMDIEIDGASMASIPPGTFKKIEVPAGQHFLRVTAGGETIFNETKRIDASRVVFETQRYLFNPDGKNLYWTYNLSEDVLADTIEKIKSGNNKTKSFSKLRKQFDVMPTKNWFAISKGTVVLENAPNANNATVLNRIAPEHYKFLKSAKQLRNPSEDDLMDLEHVFSTSIVD